MELEAIIAVNKLLSNLLAFDMLDEHIKMYERCIEADTSQVISDTRVFAFFSF